MNSLVLFKHAEKRHRWSSGRICYLLLGSRRPQILTRSVIPECFTECYFPGAYQMWAVSLLDFWQSFEAACFNFFWHSYSYLGTIPWNPIHTFVGKKTLLSPGDKRRRPSSCPQWLRVSRGETVSLCITLLKRVIINHDTKYQRNRNREPWGLLLPWRQVWEEMSWRNCHWQGARGRWVGGAPLRQKEHP